MKYIRANFLVTRAVFVKDTNICQYLYLLIRGYRRHRTLFCEVMAKFSRPKNKWII